ncbi:condensation domain-containing protein [Kribbella sp. NPDC005582]|uniref:condensation domain-containing protein n=1 Tax=Kribbella sp. NPDC005582 TaxID=3156893 RepID=UPI00339F51D2
MDNDVAEKMAVHLTGALDVPVQTTTVVRGSSLRQLVLMLDEALGERGTPLSTQLPNWRRPSVSQHDVLQNPAAYLPTIPHTFLIEGQLNVRTFLQAVEQVIDLHPILRTRYKCVDGLTGSRTEPGARAAVSFEDVRGPAAEARLRAWALDRSMVRFHYGMSPLADFSLRRFDDRLYGFSLVITHLICDGWSIENLMADISRNILEATGAGEGASSVDPKDPLDWAEEQQAFAISPAADTLVDRWKARLGHDPAVLEVTLPQWTGLDSGAPRESSRYLSRADEDAVRAYARTQRATLFTVFAAATAYSFKEASGPRLVPIYTSFANRRTRAEGRMVTWASGGIYVPVHVGADDTTGSLLRQTQIATAQSMKDGRLSMWHVRRAIWPYDLGSARGPTSLVVNVNRPRAGGLVLPGVKVAHVPVPPTGTVRGLTLWVNDIPGRLSLQLLSPADAYPAQIQEAFLESICRTVLATARAAQ